jgi:NAD(P)-dependent dehydrogenase (short-subunit alcohol dehydrogenase family)
MKLEGKVAIVTGGGTGLGKAIALEFAGAGADVVVGSRSRQNIEEVRDQVTAWGRRAMAIPVDVRVKEKVDDMAQQVIDEFGRIDILVNNAGTNRPTPVLDLTEDTWDLILDTNLKGLFFCTQAVARHMVRQKHGKIINMSSTSALGANEPGQAAYAVSKTAVGAFTKACAREFGPHGIRRRKRWRSSSRSARAPPFWAGWARLKRSPIWPCSWPRPNRTSSPPRLSPVTAEEPT